MRRLITTRRRDTLASVASYDDASAMESDAETDAAEALLRPLLSYLQQVVVGDETNVVPLRSERRY